MAPLLPPAPDYDPLTAPLELPVQRLLVAARPERPFSIPLRPGSTPGTKLNGLFKTALRRIGCQKATAAGACGAVCRHPATCPRFWLNEPSSSSINWAFPRPVRMHVPALEGLAPVAHFTMELILWGRRALALRAVIEATLREMGRLGLAIHGESVRFETAAPQYQAVQTLQARLDSMRALAWRRVLLEFQTPLVHPALAPLTAVQIAQGLDEDHPWSLAGVLGSCAADLVGWDLVDRGLDSDLSRAAAREAMHQARRAAQSAARRLTLTRCDLVKAELGKRRSRSNRGHFPLSGYLGQVELEGDLHAALPWLITLALGAGPRRALGLGVVQLWGKPASL